jgi:hypothetical protein
MADSACAVAAATGAVVGGACVYLFYIYAQPPAPGAHLPAGAAPAQHGSEDEGTAGGWAGTASAGHWARNASAAAARLRETPPVLLVFNGPSSAGKSTLVQNVQKAP